MSPNYTPAGEGLSGARRGIGKGYTKENMLDKRFIFSKNQLMNIQFSHHLFGAKAIIILNKIFRNLFFAHHVCCDCFGNQKNMEAKICFPV